MGDTFLSIIIKMLIVILIIYDIIKKLCLLKNLIFSYFLAFLLFESLQYAHLHGHEFVLFFVMMKHNDALRSAPDHSNSK